MAPWRRRWQAGRTAGKSAHVETVERADGTASLRVRGVEFARPAEASCFSGWKPRRRRGKGTSRKSNNWPGRSPGCGRPRQPIGRTHLPQPPEAWLESEVRAHPEQVDATLEPEPIYGQVPAVAGGERGILDLLAVDRAGRLAVLELKASEDIHLPLQALDYWMRVSGTWSGASSPSGATSRAWRCAAIAAAAVDRPRAGVPSKTETILRYFAPAIDVERSVWE